ncbi:hypothetical protein HY768_05670 [candidate division TA06 bacterium]|uniref:Uncharacterized protein n=1 Tax=candidate division TA06 bacterium TaxID=2250710 RepID=A0A933IDY7_UNCT6|nr:hypothetical protein [candidate division TA06 bacterium]
MTKKCWEEVHCTREDCPVKKNQEDYCWLSGSRVCLDGQTRDIRERLHQCCRDCPHFQKTLERSTGRRLTDASLLRYAKAKYGPNSAKISEFVSKTEGTRPKKTKKTAQ